MIFAMRRRTAARPRRRNPRPRLEVLEERSLLSVQLGPTWTGMSLSDSSINGEPPDPIVAAGMNNVVEMVNTDLAVYDKAGAKKFQVSMAKLFPSDAGLSFSDPQVTYDELKGQFFVGIIAYDLSSNPDQQASHFDYAILSESTISDLSSVEAAPKGSINTMESGPGGNLLADFPRVGWNADAYFVTFNMFYFSGSYDHVQLAIIPKSSGTTTQVDYDGGNFTVVPAIVHDAAPGGSMWFIEEHGYDNGSQLQVVQMTDPSKPMGLGIYYVDVPAYGAPPAAPQPGGQGIDTGDTRMLSAAVRDGHLVATQNVGTNGTAHARWYDINLASGNAAANSMALYQSGEINPGNGIATYYPAIDINQNGDLGLAYMESSKREYMSMYITGRSHGDATPAGTMQAPREVMAGMGTYRGSRAGDYSGLSVDPSDNTTFWGASEYSLGGWSYWGTAVAGFTLTADTGGGGGGGGGNGGGHGGGKPTKNAGTGLVGLAIPDLDLDEGDPLFIPGPFESGLVTDKKDRKG